MALARPGLALPEAIAERSSDILSTAADSPVSGRAADTCPAIIWRHPQVIGQISPSTPNHHGPTQHGDLPEGGPRLAGMSQTG
jgi:hypothetical protein